MYRLEFELSGLPKSQNVLMRGNRLAHHKTATKWKREVFYATRGQLPFMPLGRAFIRLTRFNYRPLDYDGLVGSFKCIVDGLVEAGVLKNDTWKITGKWNVDQEFSPKGRAFIRVEVEERDE